MIVPIVLGSLAAGALLFEGYVFVKKHKAATAAVAAAANTNSDPANAPSATAVANLMSNQTSQQLANNPAVQLAATQSYDTAALAAQLGVSQAQAIAAVETSKGNTAQAGFNQAVAASKTVTSTARYATANIPLLASPEGVSVQGATIPKGKKVDILSTSVDNGVTPPETFTATANAPQGWVAITAVLNDNDGQGDYLVSGMVPKNLLSTSAV